MPEEKEVLWEPWQFPNIPLYKTKLSDDVMNYLWSCIEQAEKDNVDNSNDYSHKLAGNISGSLGLIDVDDWFRDKIVGPLTDKKNSSSWLLHNYFERQRKIVGI